MPDFQPPNIFVLLGSPRANRFSEQLADSFLAPLIARGCAVEKCRVASLHIRPCTGCDACRHTGKCVITDDMQNIYSSLDKADWVVLVSPMYFNSVTGALKVLIDRCQPYWAKKFVLKEKSIKEHRKGYLFMSAGVGQSEENLRGPWRVADYFFKAQGILPMEMLCIDKTDSGEDAHFQQVNTAALNMGASALQQE